MIFYGGHRTPHRAGRVTQTPTRSESKPRVEPASARVASKGPKNYRIAETRTRRVDRDERFDDTDVMQRASQIVMYVRYT